MGEAYRPLRRTILSQDSQESTFGVSVTNDVCLSLRGTSQAEYSRREWLSPMFSWRFFVDNCNINRYGVSISLSRLLVESDYALLHCSELRHSRCVNVSNVFWNSPFEGSVRRRRHKLIHGVHRNINLLNFNRLRAKFQLKNGQQFN
jgi:hypothetical protein